jgi:hypothetical protein
MPQLTQKRNATGSERQRQPDYAASRMPEGRTVTAFGEASGQAERAMHGRKIGVAQSGCAGLRAQVADRNHDSQFQALSRCDGKRLAMCDNRGSQDCFVHLRRIRFNDVWGTGETRVFLANQTALPASTICDLYKIRWPMEFLVKGTKHSLGINWYYGTWEYTLQTQTPVAVLIHLYTLL